MEPPALGRGLVLSRAVLPRVSREQAVVTHTGTAGKL